MKKIIPDIIAILILAVISFVYFYPADIEGRILFQHDTTAGAAAGQEAKEYYERTGALWRACSHKCRCFEHLCDDERRLDGEHGCGVLADLS